LFKKGVDFMDQCQERERRFQIEKLEERIAPTGAAMTLENPAGNTPQSDSAANGQAINFYNPAGHAPPGQNA
jgi:hypothetical protein